MLGSDSYPPKHSEGAGNKLFSIDHVRDLDLQLIMYWIVY